MVWNWQQADWPQFYWDNNEINDLEKQFLHQSGTVIGCLRHMDEHEKTNLTIELISTEAIKTSEIEGDILDRESVQSSIRRNFGLDTQHQRIAPAERGIAEMMVDLYRTFSEPLSHNKLRSWHKMLTSGRQDLIDVGRYRTHDEAMQVVSGQAHNPTIHFEAPPSRNMHDEMTRFIEWFNNTAPKGGRPLPPLTRASIAHLYFVSIHPFEDGNGRIGRAVSEMALSQGLGQPTLLALSQTIQESRKTYYDMLEASNKDIEVTAWLNYFAKTILDAQKQSLRLIDFLIAKTQMYDRLHGQLNDRQNKVLARMFKEGPIGFEGRMGFKGGMSAEKYISITKTSRATATRDLSNLVQKKVFMRTGDRKNSRYWLKIEGANT